MKEESKEEITRKFYSLLQSISHMLKYERLDKAIGDVKLSITCMQYDLDDIKKLLDEDKEVKE